MTAVAYKHSSPSRNRRNRYRLWRHRFIGSLRVALLAHVVLPLGPVPAVRDCSLLPRPPKQQEHSGPSAKEPQKYVPPEPQHDGDGEIHLYAERLSNLLLKSNMGFALFYKSARAVVGDVMPAGRQRDIFPLPFLDAQNVTAMGDCSSSLRAEVCRLSNLCVAVLNFLNSGCCTNGHPVSLKRPHAAQKSVLEHIFRRCFRWAARIDGTDCPMTFCNAYDKFEQSGQVSFPKLQADQVDLCVVAGTCDSISLVSDGLREKLADPQNVFANPSALQATVKTAKFTVGSREEYAKLTVRELLNGKLRLRRNLKAAAEIFVVPKSTPGRLWEVWDGSVISNLAARPPKPSRLGSPAAFVEMIVPRGSHVYYSKRDGETYFDVLSAPSSWREFFGRPPLWLNELISFGGLSYDDVLGFLDDASTACESLDNCALYPCSTTWPMGFSWSSAIAQDTTLYLCRCAGVAEDSILCEEEPSPDSFAEVVTVSTDDTVLIHVDPTLAQDRSNKLDSAFDAHGVPRNTSKDISLASQITALGCELGNDPPTAEPALGKMISFITGAMDLMSRGSSSPQAFASLLGLFQWFALLCRPFFSIFSDSYHFARMCPYGRTQAVPCGVLSEIALALTLAPLLPADFSRQYLPLLAACDAAPEFGFGVSACPCDLETVHRLNKCAEKTGRFCATCARPARW